MVNQLSPEYQQYLKELDKIRQEYPYPMYNRAFHERKLRERGVQEPKELVEINRQIEEEDYETEMEGEGDENMGIGDRVVDADGIEGTIVDINGDSVRVQWDNGDKSEMHMNRLRKANGWESD